MRIGIVDYGSGNLMSVRHALEYLGAEVDICLNPKDLSAADRVVVPGVGAFADCMRNLENRNFLPALRELRERGLPILGICSGMQIMASEGEEGGKCQGLGWFSGKVVRIPETSETLRIPQIGWTEVQLKQREHPIFAKIKQNADFYFAHSYFLASEDTQCLVATCNYGKVLPVVVSYRNVVAAQFHPEKSQDNGLQFLQNFLDWDPWRSVE